MYVPPLAPVLRPRRFGRRRLGAIAPFSTPTLAPFSYSQPLSARQLFSPLPGTSPDGTGVSPTSAQLMQRPPGGQPVAVGPAQNFPPWQAPAAPIPSQAPAATDGGTFPSDGSAGAPPVNVTVTSASEYQTIFDWLGQKTLLDGIPNWILAAGAGAVVLWFTKGRR